jgi:hypothetical protein
MPSIDELEYDRSDRRCNVIASAFWLIVGMVAIGAVVWRIWG